MPPPDIYKSCYVSLHPQSRYSNNFLDMKVKKIGY